MAVVFTANLGLRKLFGEETEEEKKAAEEHVAAAKAKESAASKVPKEGCLCPCFCYPKELLKKEDEEDEELYRSLIKVVLPRRSTFWAAAQSRYCNEGLSKMFNEWATLRGKRYYSLYEWRLRFKIWCFAKKMIKQRCLNSGRTFTIDRMNSSADMTVIERARLHVFKPDRLPLVEVQRKVLVTMGVSWMENAKIEFEKWAERHERVYSSDEEREKRRLAYWENMRRIDMEEEHYPGSWKHGKDLENMDKFDWEADLIPAFKCSRCMPSHKVGSLP